MLNQNSQKELAITRIERWNFAIHAGLLLAAVCTYANDRENVVWRFIKNTPAVRTYEHFCFALAAAALFVAIWIRTSHTADHRNREILGALLQAFGIGSLMPLSGFVLLVSGELALAVLRYSLQQKETPSGLTVSGASRSRLLGRWCVFLSMVIFSITLSDRLADLLFAGSGLVTVVAFLVNRKRPSQQLSG